MMTKEKKSYHFFFTSSVNATTATELLCVHGFYILKIAQRISVQQIHFNKCFLHKILIEKNKIRFLN